MDEMCVKCDPSPSPSPVLLIFNNSLAGELNLNPLLNDLE
jgi:hypothetical protein